MARILLVDDEKVARALYGDLLTAAGHQVSAVGSVGEARTALEAHAYDVVVTDLLLPHGDGMEVLRYAKERHPDVEVIVITALDKVSPAVHAIKSGAAEYLVKPVAPEALEHAVAKALTTRQLLQENASLRRHVALLEMGQRLATSIDRSALNAEALHAFQTACGASAVLLFARQLREPVALQASVGLSMEQERALAETISPQLRDGGKPRMLELPKTEFSGAMGFPAVEGELTWGHAVLLFKQGPDQQGADNRPDASAESTAIYLAKHLALAWRNLGRFAAVEDLAYLDDLTGLFNMRYLDLVLDREVKSAAQTQGAFSVLFLDLDSFKAVNDTHGHLVGSKLLVESARVLKSCVRDNDVVVRYGGDEYVVVLRTTDSGGALKVAERIRSTFERHQFLSREGYSVQVTTCIGVASFPEHAKDKGTLLDLADRAMYRGKKSSRNVVYMAAPGLEATPAARHSAG